MPGEQAKKRYGRPPTRNIRVRVQEVESGKTLATTSFGIYGQEYGDVLGVVENALDAEYGEAADERDEEEEEEQVRTPPRIKKKRRQ